MDQAPEELKEGTRNVWTDIGQQHSAGVGLLLDHVVERKQACDLIAHESVGPHENVSREGLKGREGFSHEHITLLIGFGLTLPQEKQALYCIRVLTNAAIFFASTCTIGG